MQKFAGVCKINQNSVSGGGWRRAVARQHCRNKFRRHFSGPPALLKELYAKLGAAADHPGNLPRFCVTVGGMVLVLPAECAVPLCRPIRSIHNIHHFNARALRDEGGDSISLDGFSCQLYSLIENKQLSNYLTTS